MSRIRDFPDGMPFRVTAPVSHSTPYLFNSPHSGRLYPQAFRQMSCLDDFTLRLSEDRFVDEIFGALVHYGATFMVADFPRAYLDVNRSAFELDASMFTEPLPAFVPAPSLRAEAGFGCVARIVAAGCAIYDHKLPIEEALDRITSLYQPYHLCLRRTLQALCKRHGFAVLIDCHSMPGKKHTNPSQTRADIVLGDDHGCSCSPYLTDAAESLLRDLGLNVTRNQPYSGGYITCHYGRPTQNIHALQIEINRDLYLDSHLLEKNSGFEPLCALMVTFGRRLMMLEREIFLPFSNAAE